MKPPKNIFVQGAISPAFIANSITKHAANTQIGAHSIFLGQVRADVVNNQTVCAIEYTAYVEMASEAAHIIREEVFQKFPLTCMHIYHSLGQVEAGQICLFVFTSSQHRQAAIEACAEIVERLKKEVPVWGKELFTNQDYQWKTPNIAP